MGLEDKVLEIETFSRKLEQMNLRRNFNDDFIFYFVKAPTESRVVRKRLKVKNSLSKIIKINNPIDIQKCGTPFKKFVVPSIGSIIQ